MIEKSHGWVDSTGWVIGGDSASGRLSFAVGAGGGGIQNFVGAASVANVLDGRFHHLAGTWDGTNVLLYVDGQLQGTTPLATPFNNSRSVNIGFTWGNGTPQRFFRGTIDEASVYQRALSAGEIRAIVEVGALGKQPPASVATPTDSLAWWPLNGDFADVVGGLTGVAVGTPSFSTDGMVQSSLRLDGQTQWASLPSSGILNGRSEATIEAWVRPQGQHGSLGNPGVVWFEGTSAFGYSRFATFVLNDGHVRVGGRDSNTGTYKGVD